MNESSDKKAQVLVRRMLADIVKMGWPIGTNLGTAAQLGERYGVGRNVMREAIRIVERDGIMQSRRGIGGGLIITAPARKSVVNALFNYLALVDISADEMAIALSALLADAIASAVIHNDRVTALRALKSKKIGDEKTIWSGAQIGETLIAITDVMGNPAVPLFLQPVLQLALEQQVNGPTRARQSADIRQRMTRLCSDLIDHLIRARTKDCKSCLAELVIACVAHFKLTPAAQRQLRLSISNGSDASESAEIKLAENVMLAIYREIVKQGRVVGTNLGSESVLLDRFKVSRAVLREAVRMLERFSIAHMQCGNKGGLIVSAPNPQSAIDTAVTHLEYLQLGTAPLLELRMLLEKHLARCAANHLTETDATRLHDALEQELASKESALFRTAHNLPKLIAELSGNRILSLFFLILAEDALFRASLQKIREIKGEFARLTRTGHREIVTAIIARDMDAAETAVHRHRLGINPMYY